MISKTLHGLHCQQVHLAYSPGWGRGGTADFTGSLPALFYDLEP